ncbi:hypothetical protein L210DRAFT_3501975 [Boletus edulis BED1]|uniref:DUF6534 domain-containing protein n=1 Tax=Boletus edulis BED1 TaxID=1328754 RepID=A0AAD4C304_BOLED|nr:hypothetical protein L210DRAFT_3501975 [Boletus edulis BED1]
MVTLPSFDNTLGALLYGVFLVQVYNYYRRYPSDKAGYKAIFPRRLLETTHQAFIGHTVYWYSITNFLNIAALFGKPVWSLVFQVLIEAVVAAVVKLWEYLVDGVFGEAQSTCIEHVPDHLGKLLLDFGQLGLAIYYTVKIDQLPALPDLVNLRVVGVITLAIGVLNDAGIAIALCYYLQKMRSSHTQSNYLVRNLTLYAVNTGALTSAMSLATLLIYNFMPTNFVFAGCYFVLSKLYGVSFIAALNTRQIIRGRRSDVESNRFTALERGTERPSRSPNIPLQTDMVERDSTKVDSGREAEDHLGGVPAGPQAGGQLLPRAQGFRVVVIKIKDVEAIGTINLGKFELAASAGASGSWGSASDREHYCRAATLTLSAFTQRRLSARDDAASNTNRDANMSTIHTTLPPREETLKLHDKHLAWAFSE